MVNNKLNNNELKKAYDEQIVSDDIYSEICLEEFTESDAISAAEEGFMIGYLECLEEDT